MLEPVKNRLTRGDSTSEQYKDLNHIPSNEIKNNTLEELMSRLVSISDVSGAGVIRADGSIVSWHAENGIKPKQYIDYILKVMSATNQENVYNSQHSMFTESIQDYNGHKILTSRIRTDVLLFMVLEKRAYLGLTMLDVECCLEEIDQALEEDCSYVYENHD